MRRNLEETRAFFKNDRFAAFSGITIDEVGDDYARCSMRIEDKHLNANNVVMGGAIFTLADLCFGAASNGQAVTLSGNMNFLCPADGTLLTAEATLLRHGKTTLCYEIRITNDTGKLVAFSTVTGYKIQPN